PGMVKPSAPSGSGSSASPASVHGTPAAAPNRISGSNGSNPAGVKISCEISWAKTGASAEVRVKTAAMNRALFSTGPPGPVETETNDGIVPHLSHSYDRIGAGHPRTRSVEQVPLREIKSPAQAFKDEGLASRSRSFSLASRRSCVLREHLIRISVLSLLASVPALAGRVELLSKKGTLGPPQVIGTAGGSDISADGRFVAFLSSSPNLVPGQSDGNGGDD